MAFEDGEHVAGVNPSVFLTKNEFQCIERFLDNTDICALAQSCKSIKAIVQKTPQYIGAKNKALFFDRVKVQGDILLGKQYLGQNFLRRLVGSAAGLLACYQQLKKLSEGSFTVDQAFADQVLMADITRAVQANQCDIIHLMIALKLEIIKTKSPESTYFLDILNEETHFNYFDGYYLVSYALTLAAILASAAVATASIGVLLLASTLPLLPYCGAAAVAAIGCLAIAGYYGSQHQQGLYQFAQDDHFLCEKIVSAEPIPGR